MSESLLYRPSWQNQALALLHPSGHRRYLDECLEAKERWSYWRAIGDWLSRFHWQHFATFTFADPVSVVCADRAVKAFMRRLGKSAYAFVGLERGSSGDLVHCHGLLGGIAPDANQQSVWEKWNHGEVEHSPFDPSQGAAWYVSKNFREREWGGLVGADPVRTRRPRRGRKTKKKLAALRENLVASL